MAGRIVLVRNVGTGFTYCPPNVSLSDLWVHHGLSECFLDTVSYSFMAAFILVFGCVQYVIYRRYATSLSQRLLPKSMLFKVQIVISALMPLIAIFRFLLRLLVIKNNLQGYMILVIVCNMIMWPLSLMLVLLERRKALPSIPTWGHGLVLLLFWTMAFVKENLAFLNLQNTSWWFDNETLSDKIELGFFVTRYICTMFLFFAGIKAPGIPTAKDYFIYTRQEIEGELTEPLLVNGNQQSNQSQSAFSNFWKKCRQLLPFIWPKKSLRLQLQVIICFCLLIAGRAINLFVPIYYKKIVNSLTPVDGQQLEFKWQYILIYSSFYLLQGQGTGSFLTNLRSYLWIRIQQYTVKELQINFYSHLLNLSLRWHLGRKTGEVLRVLDRGTDSITNLLSYILFNIFPAIADILIAIIYLSINFNGWFGLIVFLTMFLYLVGTIAITEWRTKFRREMNEKDNATRAQSVDALLNYETVKYYNAEEYEINNYRTCITEYQKSEWKTMSSLSLLNMTQSFVITMGIVSGTLLCAHMIVHEQSLTVGDYVLFSTYLTQLYTPLGFFGTYYRMIQRSFIDMENMFDMFKEEPEVIDKPNAHRLTGVQGEIEFRNVTFWYVPEKPILTNINFVIPPGKTFALVGPSGSGKSTIIRLLFRFYDVKWGSILIDGFNVTDITQASLRKHIGVVPQDTVLFNKDIRYNVRYGRVDAPDEEVEEAAKASDIHDQVLTFPSGYDTLVGERGLKLSGGEKQRVAIARTILKNPQIILLDEATSSLDSQTERNIQESLNKICANRTTMIVAHRLSTVINADQILVLKDGEIRERGTHEELLERGGLYKAMWLQQIQKDEKAVKGEQDQKDDTAKGEPL